MIPHPTPAVRPAAPTRRRGPAARSRLWLAAALALAPTAGGLVGGCATAADGRKQPRAAVAPTELPAGSFARTWEVNLDLAKGNRVTGLYRVGDGLVVYTADNLVYGLTPGGSTRFVRQVGRPTSDLLPPVSTAVLADDAVEGSTAASPGSAEAAERAARGARLVFPTASTFEVYTPAGTFEKSVASEYPLGGAPAAGSGLVYIGASSRGGGRLVAFDLGRAYANERWAYQAGTIRGRPAFLRGVVYFATTAGSVYALNGDRSTPWSGLPNGAFQADRSVAADLAVDDYAVYVASTDSKLYALDRGTGKVRWQYFAQAPLMDAPVVTADSVYQAVPGEGMVKLAKESGVVGIEYREPLWTAKGVTQVVAFGGGNVYGVGSGGRIVAIDDATGEVKFASESGGFDDFAYDDAGATIYAATRAGRIVAVRPVTAPGDVGVLVAVPAVGPQG